MRRVKKLYAVFFLVTFSSCSTAAPANVPTEVDPAQSVTIKTDRSIYSSNQEIKVVITNSTSETVEYYGSCSLTLCQFTDGEWLCAIKDCDAPVVLLLPGSSTSFKEVLTGTTAETYRYQFEFLLPPTDSLLVIYSNEFTVTP